MAISMNFMKGVGKDATYSSLNVLGHLAPNTSDLLRTSKMGANTVKDFVRASSSQVDSAASMFTDSSANRKARSFIEDAWNDIRQGKAAIGNLSKQSTAEAKQSLTDQQSSIVSYSDQKVDEATPTTEIPNTRFIQDNSKLLDGMEQLATVLGNTNIKTAKYQTGHVVNAIFAQMTNQTEHFIVMEKQLDSINKNLVQLVTFQRDSQAVTNQAHLRFYDSATKWMSTMDKRSSSRASGTGSASGNLMAGKTFSADNYKKIIQGNLQGMKSDGLLAMLNAMDINSGNSKAAPVKTGKGKGADLAVDLLLKALVPSQAKRSISRGDSQVNTMMKSALGKLGNYRYSMDQNPILGLLGSIFGIDTRSNRVMSLGSYNRGNMSWNGDAQKVLTTVIPKELSEIKSAILKQEPKYYDAQSGKYMSPKEAKSRARTQLHNAMETPMANLYNKTLSLNPEAVKDRTFWGKMSPEQQKQISDLANLAAQNKEGMTQEIARQLDELMSGAIAPNGGTKTDTTRMVTELINAVNKSRGQTTQIIRHMEEQNDALSQILVDSGIVNKYGDISYDNFKDFIEADEIDLQAANSGRYTQTGKNYERMGALGRSKYNSNMDLISNMTKKFRDLPNSKNKAVSKIGSYLNKGLDMEINGINTKYGTAASGKIDQIFGSLYDMTILGKVPSKLEKAANQFQTMNGNVNQAYAESTKENTDSPENRTASASEQTAENVDSAIGKQGFLTKMFNSPMIQKMFTWAKGSKAGQAVKSKGSQAATFLKSLFTEEYTDDEGVKHESVQTSLGDLVGRYKKFMMSHLGIDPKTGKETAEEDTVVAAAKEAAEAIQDTTEVISGEKTSKSKTASKTKRTKTIHTITSSLTDTIRKRAPKILTGGVLGAGIAASTGGQLGLIGSLFLPGGPIGGAIAGMGLSFLGQTESFKKVIFGEKGEDGTRVGGIIDKKMRDSFKKALPTLGIGASAGAIIGILGKAAGVNSGPFGSIINTFLPGGIMGAAILGSAGAFAIKSDAVQNILFGDKAEDGKRQGSFFSNIYNKITGKIKAGGQKEDTGFLQGKMKAGLTGAAMGAVTSATFSKLGLIGSAMTPGGVIGGALVGAAINISGVGDKFHDYIFGSTDKETGKKKHDGLLSRFNTMLNLNFLEPAKNYFTSTTKEFAWWAKEKIEVPFRLAFGPIVDSFSDLRDTFKDFSMDLLKKAAAKVTEGIGNVFNTIGKVTTHKLIAPVLKGAGAILKTSLFGIGSVVSAPLQILSLLTSKKRRKDTKKFTQNLRDNREANTQDLGFGDKLLYKLATLPGIGSIFRNNDLMAGFADQYGEENGRNTLGWMTASRDRRTYKSKRQAVQRDAKEERKIQNLRAKWGWDDKNNRDRILSDDEFKKRKRKLARKGIKIKDQDDLQKFQYEYDSWKNPGKAAKEEADRVKTPQNVEDINKKLTTVTELISEILDVNRANFDIHTGTTVDSSNLRPGTYANTVDTDVTEEILKERAKGTSLAVIETIQSEEERKRKAERDSKVRGNTSGNAHDGSDPQDINGESGGSSSTTIVEKKDGLFSKLLQGGSALGLISKLFAIPGLAATLGITAGGILLSNDTVRNAIVGAIKGTVGVAFKGAGDMLGLSNNYTNQRTLEMDENGKATATVKNTGLGSSVKDLAGGKAMLGLVKPAVNAFARNQSAALGLAFRGMPSGVGYAVSRATADAIVKESLDNSSVFIKGLKLLQDALLTVSRSRLGTKFAGIASISTKIATFFGKIQSKLTGAVVVKYSPKMAAAIAAGTANNTATVAPPWAAIRAVWAGLSAIKGVIDAPHLFQVDEDEVTWKMRLVSGILGAVTDTTTIGMIASVISEVTEEIVGTNFISEVAGIIYGVIATEKQDAAFKDARTSFKTEVDNYNEANGTNISAAAYNDLKNKGFWGGTWNNIKKIFGGGDKTDYSQYEVKSSSTGYGRGQQYDSDQAVGYGPAQNDPRWGSMPIGRFPNGKISTMRSGGCGPTALSAAANAVGLGSSPQSIANMAISNGYISQGGANDGLFDMGARQIGLDTRRVQSPKDIAASLKSGNPVIMAGRSSGYGSTPYTNAGHIVTATGLDSHGNVTVQDPMSGRPGKYKLSDMQSRMTGAWSVRRGARGYGLISDALGTSMNAITKIAYDKMNIKQNAGDTAGATMTTQGGSFSGGGGSRGGGAGVQSDLGAVAARFESSGNPATVSSGSGDAGGVSFGTYQLATKNAEFVKDNTMLAQFWSKYYATQYPNVKPGNNQPFITAWKAAANANPAAFQANEHAFFADSYYVPFRQRNLTVLDPDKHSRAAQEIWWSTAIQYGQFSKVLQKALGGKSPSSMDAPSLIKAVQDYKTNTVGDYYGKSSASVQKGVRKRFNETERAALMEIANQSPLGYGIFDDALGGAFSSITDLAYNKMGITRAAPDTENGQSGMTTTGFPVVQGTDAQNKVVNQMRSIMGQVKYSIKPGDPQDPDKGTASCASTVGWAYKKALGVTGMSASSTAQSRDGRFKTIYQNDGTPLDVSILQPGDVIYQNWKQTQNDGNMQHTEMYAGNGQDLTHGGPGNGPTVKALDDYRRKHAMMVRRYNPVPGLATAGNSVGFGPGDTSDPTSGGDFSLNNIGQYEHRTSLRTTGYGPGNSIALTSNNRGVESRLDTIITVLQRIAARKSSDSVAYGLATEKTTTAQPIIIKEAAEGPRLKGNEMDSQTDYLRSIHRHIAAASHA